MDVNVTCLALLDSALTLGNLIIDPIFVIGLILIGLVVGTAIGLSGIGGAPLLLPLLILVGIPPQMVIGADLAFIFGTKLFASILHGKERNINWQALTYLLIPIVPTMVFASWIWTNIKENYGSDVLDTVILLLLGSILVCVSLYMIKSNVWKKNNNTESQKNLDHKLKKNQKSIFLGAGSIISFITQITATGAGALTLPILVKKCNCPPKHVAGTSVVFGVAISAIGTILHYNMGNVPIFLVLFLLLGSIPGVLIGVKMTSKISPRILIATFSIVILIAAIFLINRGFGII